MTDSPIIGGHRGFKAKYPENTLLGFAKCFESGATVIETDVWVLKDNVVVISHDGLTARIFVDDEGNETSYKIVNTNYYGVLEHLKERESGEPLHTFSSVLKWFVKQTEGRDDLRLMLDIKRPNPSKIMKLIIKDLLSVRDDISWWYPRIQFGIWDLKVIKYLNQEEYFKTIFDGKRNWLGYNQFDIIHIGVSWQDSVHYINYNLYIDNYINDLKNRLLDKDEIEFKHKVTGVSLIYLTTWTPGFLTEFMPLLKLQNMSLFLWTINTDSQFDYLCRLGKAYRIREYGVITDLPDYMVDRKERELRASKESTALVKPNLELSYKQSIMARLFSGFQGLSTTKRVTDEELVFNLHVDEEKSVEVIPSKAFVWVFQTCQKWGIF